MLNIVVTQRNNEIIENNRELQKQAENIKVTVSQFAIDIIHNLDLGLRSYALYGKEKYLYPMDLAIREKDSLMSVVGRALSRQQYSLKEFEQLRDSINAYAVFCRNLRRLYEAGSMAEFHRLSDMDKGYHLWLQYEKFARNVYAFENEITEKAQEKYEGALRNNYLIQIFLLLISVPTLLFTAIHTNKKFAFEFRLRQAEADKTGLLASEKIRLERLVMERTQEIQIKNKELQEKYEEISAQNEEISAQNDELNGQREELALQNKMLNESKKQQLEVYKQNLMEKSEMISRITQELEILKGKFLPEPEQIRKFNNILHFSILTDEDWERFKKTFQEVYPNFFAALRYRFPAITASELRLSALIKMNLSLKEAAAMLGISADSVKKSRYRLKKRLGLVDEASLEEFVRNLV